MSEPINYFCVDDEDIRSYLTYLTTAEPRLSIKPGLPAEFESEVDNLKDQIQDNGFDGLMLDLKLDGLGSKVRYRAPALVQEIHTRAAEHLFPVRPLVLWSNDQKLNESYWSDDTSHDLFDLTIDKDKLRGSDDSYAPTKARKMVALSDGYNQIMAEGAKDGERVNSLLAMPEDLISQLDPRIFQLLDLNEASIYEQARFIHRQLLAIPNSALISSEILGARLGLNIKEVADFDNFAKSLFPEAAYNGVFSQGWPCWWSPIVEEIWDNIPDCPGALRKLNAEERVDFIKASTTRDDIKPAQAMDLASSTFFWTVCQITRRPLDPKEGYVVDRQLYPWQLTQYLSLYGKLDGTKVSERIRVDPLDVERYMKDKKAKIGK